MAQIKEDSIMNHVRMLLTVEPTVRDDDGHLSLLYKHNYWQGSFEDFIMDRMPSKIERVRRLLQHADPKLRGKKYEERQSYAKVVREKMRSQEKPEDLSNMFEPIEEKWIKFEKENTLQYIERKIKSLFS